MKKLYRITTEIINLNIFDVEIFEDYEFAKARYDELNTEIEENNLGMHILVELDTIYR